MIRRSEVTTPREQRDTDIHWSHFDSSTTNIPEIRLSQEHTDSFLFPENIQTRNIWRQTPQSGEGNEERLAFDSRLTRTGCDNDVPRGGGGVFYLQYPEPTLTSDRVRSPSTAGQSCLKRSATQPPRPPPPVGGCQLGAVLCKYPELIP